MYSDLNVAVIGCGSIGRRHIKNLWTLGVRKFILCDSSVEALDLASADIKNPVLAKSFNVALEKGADAAVICTPSSMHLEMSTAMAARGVHLLIEKPLSDTLDGVEDLEDTVRRNGVTAMMAMCYRFHPVLKRLKGLLEEDTIGRLYHVNYYGGHYLPDWHPHADYRREYAARRQLGGGVVLTSIHGLDNVRWLFGDVADVRGFVDKLSDLEMDVEDFAAAVFRLKNGLFVNWQTDFLQRSNTHRIIVTGENGTIRVDAITGEIEIFTVSSGAWKTEKVPFDINRMYVDELEHFLECVSTGTTPVAGLKEGIKTLELAVEVKKNAVESENLCAVA